MTVTGITHPDIIDDLLERLRVPSLILLEGSPGVGKALFISTLINEYIKRGRGKASIVNFMLTRETSIRYAARYGIDLDKHIREGNLRIYEVLSIPFSASGEEALSQLFMVVDNAASFAGDGIVALYPADLVLLGLDTRDIIRFIGMLNDLMRVYKCKFILSFTDHDSTRVRLIMKIFEAVADYVFRLNVETPEAGAPRRYLTIVKPLRELAGISRTLELYVEHGVGYRLFSYGILPRYEAKIDPFDRVYSGIEMLDELVEGFIRGTIIAVIGSSGAGKTPLLLASSYNMAEKGENVLYISLEEPVNQLIATLRVLGYNYEEVKDNFSIYNINPRTITAHSLFHIILEKMKDNPSIVVIDGIHSLFKEFGERIHKSIKDISYYMKSTGRILFFTMIEDLPGVPTTLLSTIADGIIRLILRRRDYDYERMLCLEKYRVKYITPRCTSYMIPVRYR